MCVIAQGQHWEERVYKDCWKAVGNLEDMEKNQECVTEAKTEVNEVPGLEDTWRVFIYLSKRRE